jgi:hypothetical protein
MPSGSWGCLLAHAWERADGPVPAQSRKSIRIAPMAQARGLAGVARPRATQTGPAERAGYSIPNERFVLGTIA